MHAMKEQVITTQEKIKQAAEELFMVKGYAATKTRDIAQASGINLALLNYHFKSKENLFSIIMKERFLTFFGSVLPLFNDKETSLQQKFEKITDKYFEILRQNPDLPLFVLGEANKNPEGFAEGLSGVEFINNSYFTQQVKAINPGIQPENMLINLLSVVVFPFIMKPVLNLLSTQQEFNFEQMMQERKQMIPLWMNSLLTQQNENNEI